MKKLLFVIASAIMLISCGGGKSNDVQVTGADKYIKTISGFTCVKATVTENKMLVIAIDAIPGSDYDKLAEQFLEEAKKEGVTGLKGCSIVDSKKCKFYVGSVSGKRIGHAYTE